MTLVDPLSTPNAAPTDALKLLHLHSRRMMVACGIGFSMAVMAVLALIAFTHINQFQAQRISEFRRAHNAVQMELSRLEAGYARLASMAEYAWEHPPQPHNGRREELRQRYLEGGQRVMIVGDADGRPQMALGLHTDRWDPARLDRYLQLSQTMSHARVAPGPAEHTPMGSSYFFDPTANYLSLCHGLSEAQLKHSLGVSTRQQLFDTLRASAGLISAASSNDSLPMLAGVGRKSHARWSMDRHPLTGESSLVASFYAHQNETPVAAFVSYEPIPTMVALMRANSGGRIALVNDGGAPVAATYTVTDSQERDLEKLAGTWLLLGDAVRARPHDGGFTLVLPVESTSWFLVEHFTWQDVLGGIIAPMRAALAIAAALLLALWTLLLRLQRRTCVPAQKAADELCQRQQLQQVLMDRLPQGVVLLEPATGSITFSNRSMRRMSEHTSPPLLSRLQDGSIRQCALDAGDAGTAAIPLNDNGRQRFQLRAFHLHTVPGSPILAVVEDVLPWTEQIDTCRHALNAAVDRIEAKSAFVASISHEIRTPMHGIMGHLELLARSTLEREQQQRVARLRQATDSLMRVIGTALDFSQAEYGQLVAPSVNFSPAALLERVTLLFAPLALAKDLDLDHAVDPRVPAVCLATEDHIERILRNLVGNAIKFTTSGRVQLTLSHQRVADQDALKFEIVDSGIGMSAEERAQLFQPFVQANAGISKRFGGSGLGLALCRQLCEGQGAWIDIESTPAVGSRFIVTVPVDVVQGPRPSPWPLDPAMAPKPSWSADLESML